MKQLTRQDVKEVVLGAIRESDVVTGKSLKMSLDNFEAKVGRKLNKLEKTLRGDIAKVAFDSPTLRQFSELERRVDKN